MEKDKFSTITLNVQGIIDLIAKKNRNEATIKLVEVSEELNELLDFTEEDADLIEISRYQALLVQLHQKIIALNGHLKQ